MLCTSLYRVGYLLFTILYLDRSKSKYSKVLSLIIHHIDSEIVAWNLRYHLAIPFLTTTLTTTTTTLQMVVSTMKLSHLKQKGSLKNTAEYPSIITIISLPRPDQHSPPGLMPMVMVIVVIAITPIVIG